jgi:segregation and condensation protein A
MENSSYEVDLEVFTGPLDLLLHLIEQQQLDITTVSLARVTDQYLAYLRVVEQRSPDDLADFVSIAARLLLIKSRALLPSPEALDDEEEEDVGEDLVRQLREYRRFKQIAESLNERDQQGLHNYLRTLPTSKIVQLAPRLDLEGTSLDNLIAALRDMLADEAVEGDELDVVPYRVTISQRIEHIRGFLREGRTATFAELVAGSHSRLEIIVTLLAVLEMIRSGRATAWQEGLFGPISIKAIEKKETAEPETSSGP